MGSVFKNQLLLLAAENIKYRLFYLQNLIDNVGDI